MTELDKFEEIIILEDQLRMTEAKLEAMKDQKPHLRGTDAIFASQKAITVWEDECEELLDALMEIYDDGMCYG